MINLDSNLFDTSETEIKLSQKENKEINFIAPITPKTAFLNI